MRRALAWMVTLSLSAAGVLAGHALAYRLTGAASEGVHGYLAHAPQLLLVLATVALGALAFTSRAPRLAAWPFPAVAIGAFAVQEHAERLVHTGELPWLLTRPSFLVGLALQVPVALTAWLLARRLLRALRCGRARRLPPRTSSLELPLSETPSLSPALRVVGGVRVRGPPALLQTC